MTNLVVQDRPIPAARPGWARIEVKAFGLNRSELHTRLRPAQGVTFPRVIGGTGCRRAALGFHVSVS